MELIKDDIKVEWTDLGEGRCGDYDPSNPDDVHFLRFDLYHMVEGEWQPMEDASYCTFMPADTDQQTLASGLAMIMNEVTDAIYNGESYRTACHKLSWMTPEWVQE